MFERLVYVSRAIPGVGPRDAYDIIRVSHNRNSQFGLTGALLLIDGHFVQVLEGHRHRVRERFERITSDARHTQLDLRLSVQSDRLLFPDEWMALRHGHEIPASVQSAFGYAPGLPVAQFDGERITAFVLACCRLQVQAGA